jgi:hypothetical protein
MLFLWPFELPYQNRKWFIMLKIIESFANLALHSELFPPLYYMYLLTSKCNIGTPKYYQIFSVKANPEYELISRATLRRIKQSGF